MAEIIVFDGSRQVRRFVPPYPQRKETIRKTVPPAGTNQNTEACVLYRWEVLRMSIEQIAAREKLRRLYVQDIIRRAFSTRRAA
jgi:hypothetical protein